MQYSDIVVLGKNGRLGNALCAAQNVPRLHTPDRDEISGWLEPKAALEWFENIPAPAQIHVAVGVVDPAAPPNTLNAVNVALPAAVLEAASQLGHHVVTYGTVMEAISKQGQRNPYVESKVRLAELVSDIRTRGTTAVHFRLHTLYGGKLPHPFMFAGQMLHSIKSRVPFDMTDGLQFREYHHVEDEAKAILASRPQEAVVELTSGESIRLRDLATSVFSAFDALNLLHLGAIDSPKTEFYDQTAVSNVPTVQGIFRTAEAGVTEWFTKLGLKSNSGLYEAKFHE